MSCAPFVESGRFSANITGQCWTPTLRYDAGEDVTTRVTPPRGTHTGTATHPFAVSICVTLVARVTRSELESKAAEAR